MNCPELLRTVNLSRELLLQPSRKKSRDFLPLASQGCASLFVAIMAEGVKDPLSMSLDDIIAKSTKTDSSRRGRGPARGSRSSRGSGSRATGRGGKPTDIIVRVRNEGRIQKPVTDRRGAGRVRSGFPDLSCTPDCLAVGDLHLLRCVVQGRDFLNEPDEPRQIKSRKLDGDLAWDHDKAPRSTGPTRREYAPVAMPVPAAVSRAPVGSSQL